MAPEERVVAPAVGGMGEAIGAGEGPEGKAGVIATPAPLRAAFKWRDCRPSIGRFRLGDVSFSPETPVSLAVNGVVEDAGAAEPI